MFPIHDFTPALGVGGVAMVILAIGLVALYVKHLGGAKALDIRGHRGHLALSQLLCADRAGLPENLID
jgi:hypothetical protein